ncbi:MAG: amidohydrolase family protein [Pseudomonadota bacterium]
MTDIIRNKIFALAVSIAAVAPATAQTTAIMNGRVLTGDGRTIEEGDVIIRNGRIAQVGADLSAPAGAEVVDATGKVVTPGLFAPYSSIGLVEIGLDAEANDSGPQRDAGFPLGASLNAADAYRPSSTLIPVNRAGGVTRAVSAPSPGDSMFGGRAAVIDLSGGDGSLIRDNAGQVLSLGYGGATRAGDTRMGVWALLRETLDEAKEYAANPNDYERRYRDGRYKIADLKALGPVINGRQPLLASVNGEVDIRNLIRLKNDYRLRVIIVGGTEAWKAAPAIAAANIPVILDPFSNLPSQFEDLGATLENAARLEAVGVKIAFYGAGAHNLRALPQHAGNAVANGLPYDAAIAALTKNPAEIFGLGGDMGTLTPNKVADVVIWDGDPLEVTSAAEAVFINGVEQDLTNRQTVLRERYRTLERGDLPFAYRGRE